MFIQSWLLKELEQILLGMLNMTLDTKKFQKRFLMNASQKAWMLKILYLFSILQAQLGSQKGFSTQQEGISYKQLSLISLSLITKMKKYTGVLQM